jgi:hypothetical protein
MPSIGAALAATLAGFIVDAMLEPYLGVGPTLIASFACSTWIFFLARKWLIELRGG